MIYARRYVQFNDLVIDGYDMIKETNSSVSTKQNTETLPYTHGDYVPFKHNYMLMEPQEVSMTLTLHMKKLECEKRPFYRTHAIEQLMKPGKLWAIQNGEIVWAYAYVTNLDPDEGALSNTLSAVVDFNVYEGIWHKADKQRTFLRDYDVCDLFDECSDFKIVNPCKENNIDCCNDCYEKKELPNPSCECCCDRVNESMALCNFKHLDDYFDCTTGYKIEYDCKQAEKIFGDIGQKICAKDACSNIIAGQLYSDTDIPTSDVTIILSKGGKNPRITINDNTNTILGEYDGKLVIKPNGDVIHITDCCSEYLTADVWAIPPGQKYGWEVHRGNNRFIVDSCCAGACAYVDVGGITV